MHLKILKYNKRVISLFSRNCVMICLFFKYLPKRFITNKYIIKGVSKVMQLKCLSSSVLCPLTVQKIPQKYE